jgi:hypothetical protein
VYRKVFIFKKDHKKLEPTAEALGTFPFKRKIFRKEEKNNKRSEVKRIKTLQKSSKMD